MPIVINGVANLPHPKIKDLVVPEADVKCPICGRVLWTTQASFRSKGLLNFMDNDQATFRIGRNNYVCLCFGGNCMEIYKAAPL